MYVDIEDRRWAKFRVDRGHGKVYLPEQLLLTEVEYLRQKNMEQKKIAKELEVSYSQFTAGELKGVGFKQQQQQLDEAKAEHERKLMERKREYDGGISNPEEDLSTGVRPSSPPGQRVDVYAVSAEEIEEQRIKLEHFKQEKKKSQTNATGSDKVSYTATPAVTRGIPGGAGMPHNDTHPSAVGRVGNGSIWHHHSGHQPGHPERCVDHQHQSPHARQEQYDRGRVDRGQRLPSPQNVTDYNYNSKSGDGRGHLHDYHRQGSNSGQHQPAGTNQPPPGSPNLAINPGYGEIPPGSSAGPYHAKNTSDDYQHKERPTPAPRHTPIMDRHQQPEEQLPSWPTMETVVVVRNAEFQNPVTGTVRFIGRIQGFDEFVVGLVLVSCMFALLSMYSHFVFVECSS